MTDLREAAVRALNFAGLDERANLREKSDEYLATALQELSESWMPVRRDVDKMGGVDQTDYRQAFVRERLARAAAEADAQDQVDTAGGNMMDRISSKRREYAGALAEQ